MWKVAPSYENANIVKIDEEAHKALVEETCHRCGGSGAYVIPGIFMGTCFACNGAGKIRKWVKAYTEKEYNTYMTSQARAKERKQKKEEERIQSLKDNSEENKKELLAKWGFDVENPLVWLVTGKDTYAVKDELKELGCKFNPALGWWATQPKDIPVNYGMIGVAFDKVYDWFPMVKRFELKEDAKETAAAARISAMPESKSEWIGTIKERMRDLKVVLTGARECNSAYGFSTLYTFEQGENHLAWFTTSIPKVEMVIGHSYLLTGTVKKFDERDGIKITQLNRCVLKEI